jgi:hypothetical protein
MKALRIAIAFLAFPAAFAASAADDVTEAITAAYAPYRVALFRTNSNAQAESEQAIAEAQKQWQAFANRYLEKRPPPYDRDPAFTVTVKEVAQVYQAAEAEIRSRQLPRAHETLERARDLMADLRHRNGVVAYSDHMNAYHARMEHVLQEGAKTLGQPNGALLLMAHVGVLEFLAGQLRSEAPKNVASQADFSAAVQAVEGSVANLKKALLSQDQAQTREMLGRLKGPYSKLFLNFG